MGGSLEIRPLKRDDADMYGPVRLRALKEEPESFGESYEEGCERTIESIAEMLDRDCNDSFVLGAFVNDELAGTVGCVRRDRLKIRHQAQIWGMYVAPEHRGKGIGKALLKAAIARAAAIDGLEQICLSVVTTNEAARSAYLKLGFKTFGLEPRALKVDGKYLDEEHMILMLHD